MTLRFNMRREDVLAFSREYYAASPTFRRTQTRVRLLLPVIMLVLWLITTTQSGFSWASTIIFFGVALLWFFLYPARYVRNVERYAEKLIDEGSQSKSFGSCQLTLSDTGLHDKSPSGESKFHWSTVDRALLTDSYLFIFLNGPLGFPIPIADVGDEAARSALQFVNRHLTSEGGAGQSATAPVVAIYDNFNP